VKATTVPNARLVTQLSRLLANPKVFFDGTRSERWRRCFVFFFCVTLSISIIAPVVNFLGIDSTDLSSSYQAQIAAYKFVKSSLIGRYGSCAYFAEPFLILAFSLPILAFLTILLHVVY